MDRRTFEGKWEEIERLAPELAGRTVRLIVLDEAELPVRLDTALSDLIAHAEKIAKDLPSPPVLNPSDPWAEGGVAKFGRQGFQL